MKRDHLKRTLTVIFLRFLKLLKLKENSTTALRPLKVFNSGKRHHHCLKVFNTERGLLHHFLETLKSYNFEK